MWRADEVRENFEICGHGTGELRVPEYTGRIRMAWLDVTLTAPLAYCSPTCFVSLRVSIVAEASRTRALIVRPFFAASKRTLRSIVFHTSRSAFPMPTGRLPASTRALPATVGPLLRS